MTNMQTSEVLQHLRTSVLREAGGLSDRQLLETFIERRDEVAFEAMVLQPANYASRNRCLLLIAECTPTVGGRRRRRANSWDSLFPVIYVLPEHSA